MRAAAALLCVGLAAVLPARAQSMSVAPPADQVLVVTATSTGTWSVTFPRPTRSSAPVVLAQPRLNAASAPNQTICGVTAISATTASGTCSVSQGSTATLNASIQPFVAAGAIAVAVVVKEPTS